MRLGQLARKLSLRPAQIVEFLALNNVQIVDNSNTRIEDNHTELVINHFAPGTFQQMSESIDEPEEIIPVEKELPIVEVETQTETSESHVNEESEVIRVPKIELSGLKVLGKIELPEPKKKEPVEEQVENVNTPSVEEKPSTEQKPRLQRPKGKKTHVKRDRPQGEWKNPLEQKREREAREAQEKKRMEIEREKEKRKKHYQQKVKATTQPK